MKNISELVNNYKTKQNPPAHEKAASVVEILKVVPETNEYNFGYWLKKIGQVKYGTVLAIMKDAKNLDKKYNKGGYVTNRLKEYNANTSTK